MAASCPGASSAASWRTTWAQGHNVRRAVPFVAAPPGHLHPRRGAAPRGLLGQPGLTDPRLPGHQHHPAAPAPRAGQDPIQRSELIIPPDQLIGGGLGALRDGGRQRRASLTGRSTGLTRRRAGLLRWRRPVQPGVLAQDAGLQLPQPPARVDAQLIGQRAARGLERLQRLGLPARPVQGQHQQPGQPLTEPVAAGQLLQLGDHGGVAAQVQVGGKAVFQRGNPQFLQPVPLGLGERLIGHLGQRRSPPQRQPLAQHPGRSRRPARLQQPVTLGGQRGKTGRIQVPGADHQPVAGGLAHQHPRRGPGRAVRLQRPPQIRHIRLQRGGRLRRRLLSPQLLDQPIQRHHMVSVDQQDREQHTLLGASQLDPALPVLGLERSQQPELHHPGRLIRLQTCCQPRLRQLVSTMPRGCKTPASTVHATARIRTSCRRRPVSVLTAPVPTSRPRRPQARRLGAR